MPVGMLTLELHLPGCSSLKEKRRRLKPLLQRLHKEFNIAAAEIEALDAWQKAVIGCVTISNESAHAQRSLQRVLQWLETHWHDGWVVQHRIEIC